MTYQELQDRLSSLRFRQVILKHLVSVLDSDFLPALEQPPKKVLLTDDKMRVPVEAFETVASEITELLKAIGEEESMLLSSVITVQPPQQVTPTQSETAK
jgi:hypothetical protein